MIIYNTNIEELNKENEKLRRMLEENEKLFVDNRDDLYYEISDLKRLLNQFVPYEFHEIIQWSSRETEAKNFLNKYKNNKHNFREQRLNK